MDPTAPVFVPKLYSNVLRFPSTPLHTKKMDASAITPPSSHKFGIYQTPTLNQTTKVPVTPPESPPKMAKPRTKDEFTKELEKAVRDLGLHQDANKSKSTVTDSAAIGSRISASNLTINGRSPPRGPAKWIRAQEAAAIKDKSADVYKIPFHRHGQSSTNTFVSASSVSDPFTASAPISEFSPVSSVSQSKISDVFGEITFSVGNFRGYNETSFVEKSVSYFNNTGNLHLNASSQTPKDHNIGGASAAKTSPDSVSFDGSSTIRPEASAEIKQYAAATWSRVNANIRRQYPPEIQPHRVCPYVPRTYNEYVNHIEEMVELRAQAVEKRNLNLAKNKAAGLKHGEIGQAFGGKVFGSVNGSMTLNPVNRGAVLGQETIWCKNPYPAWHFEAGWPCEGELKWEGDSRIATERGIFRRFLPLSRVSREHPLWQDDYRVRPLNNVHTFDNLWPIPDMQDVYLPIDEIEEETVPRLINQSLLDEIDNLVL